jgi:DNA-binding NarL/FixJ family response regulator
LAGEIEVSEVKMSSIHVLIADDHSSFRQDLRQACELEEGLEVVGEAGNGREVVALAHELHPDVVLIDIDLSLLDGVQATRLITAQSPSTHVIALTTCPRDERVLRAIRAGANSCLCKDVAKSALTEAIRAVHRGEALIDPVVTAMVFDGLRCIGERLA